MKANAEHFFKAFEHCLKCKMNDRQALVMANGFDRQGLQDASAGCVHYALRYKAAGLNHSTVRSPGESNGG